MKIQIHYSLGIGGFDGYRTVTLPKYLENVSDNKIWNWAENWLHTHIRDFRYDLDDWMFIE